MKPRLAIPLPYWKLDRAQLGKIREPSLYGRFDLPYDGNAPGTARI